MPGASNIQVKRTKIARRPDKSASAQAQGRARVETIAKGTPDEVQEVCADLETRGDLVPDIDFEPEEDGDEDRDELLNSEIDNSDEDDSFVDGRDEDPLDPPDAQLRAVSRDSEADDDLSIGSTWHFIVQDGVCSFERPHWIRWRPTCKNGKDALGEIERRMQMMDRIASWLTSNRGAFLRNPDPWLLGCDAWKEFKEGHASVADGHFVEIAGISDLCGKSLFSRYRRAALLEWEDATMPLDFLFGPEARMAWVANAVKQAATEYREPVGDLVSCHEKATKPREGRKRRELAKTKTKHLDWPNLIAQANALARTKWDEVLKTYRHRMLE